MKVERNFHRPEVVQRLEIIDEELLARLLADTPTAELYEWQKAGVMQAIAAMDAGQGIPHEEIVRFVQDQE